MKRWIGRKKDKVILELLKFDELKFDPNGIEVGKGGALDVETTGLNFEEHEVIEMGLIVFGYTKEGAITKIYHQFNELQEPSKPLDAKIIEVTGIQDKDLRGKSIDWNEFDNLLSDVDFIVAHNAKFDRPFTEKYSKKSRDLDWFCSLTDINWKEWDFPERSLKNLGFYHGFFYEAHRALVDCQALLYLLTFPAPESSKNYLSYLLDLKSRVNYLVISRKTTYNKKHIFNNLEHAFEPNFKVWYKYYETKDEAVEVIDHIKKNVYTKGFESVELVEINNSLRFKSLKALSQIGNPDPKVSSQDSNEFTKPYIIFALNTKISTKDTFKNRGYEFREEHGCWFAYVTEEESEVEKQWLKDEIYKGNFKGIIKNNPKYKG